MLRDCCVVYVAAKIHGDRQSTTHDASRYARQQRRRTVSLVTHRAPIFPLTGVHGPLLRPSRYSKIILPRGWASSNWLRNAAASETTKERWNAAELQRISGELALKSPERDAWRAEEYFERALTIARQQQAKSWELRAAMSLARLWREQGKPQQARELLASVYGWFTEGFATRDLKDAKVLLEELHA